MPTPSSRRAFVIAAPAAALGAGALLRPRAVRADTPAPPSPAHDAFPRQDPDLVRQAVGWSHGNIDGLRELLADQPELAKASWDWGFGDWETCLGAASHTGRVEIAELLLEHGARPTLFSAAMLGQLDVVRAFVEAQPGVQRLAGPHGISLLRHAQAGRERAARVLAYLESLGDAEPDLGEQPLSTADRDRLVGEYAWADDDRSRCAVEIRREMLFFTPADAPARGLIHHGDLAFSPAGAPSVRIVFTAPPDGPAASVRITGSGADLVAKRIVG
ncbi:MAG: hypothetical protein ACF8QF_08135 [Phycisphaerales bacterium]